MYQVYHARLLQVRLLRPRAQRHLESLDTDIDEAGGLNIGVELRAGTRVSTNGSEALDEYVIPLAEVMLLSERIVVGLVVYVKILKLSPAARTQVSRQGTVSWSTTAAVYIWLWSELNILVSPLDICGPIVDGGSHVPRDDVVELEGIGPVLFDVIDFELQVGRDPLLWR